MHFCSSKSAFLVLIDIGLYAFDVLAYILNLLNQTADLRSSAMPKVAWHGAFAQRTDEFSGQNLQRTQLLKHTPRRPLIKLLTGKIPRVHAFALIRLTLQIDNGRKSHNFN